MSSPFVDAHILEQAVAVDRPPRAWLLDTDAQHRLLPLEVGVGLVEGRQTAPRTNDAPHTPLELSLDTAFTHVERHLA
jgi:hypothetical protein